MGSVQRDPNVYCGGCGEFVAPDEPDGTRRPCRRCGSTMQQVRIQIEDTVSLHEEIRITAREGAPGQAAPHLKIRQGASWSRRLGRWLYRTMRIDRRDNRYEETVTDPATGELVHHDEGPLSEHVGHGSAKERSR